MNADGGDYGVLFGVDDADVVGAGVDHVNFILPEIRRNASWLKADGNCLRRLEGPQIDDAHSVAFAVGDVGIFAIGWAVIRQRVLAEVPPCERGQERDQNNDEEKFSQDQVKYQEATRLAEMVMGMAGEAEVVCCGG